MTRLVRALLAALALFLVPACGGSGDTTIIQQSNGVPPSGTLVGLTADGLTLVFIDPAVPNVPLRILPVILPTAATLETIAFRPVTKTLYAHADNGVTYEIDLQTGGGVRAGNVSFFLLGGPTAFSMSFSPVSDIIRMVDNQLNNTRVDPISNSPTNDPVLSAAVSRIAYTNNFVGATVTTLFGVDNTNIVRIGGVDGIPSPNGGVVTIIGPHGIPIGAGPPQGFAMTPGGTAYVVKPSSSVVAELWTIDLTAAVPATKVGPFGTGANLLGLAVMP